LDCQGSLTSLWHKFNDVYARVFGKSRVSNEDFLYRRIHPYWQKSSSEVSTAAFTDPNLSVDLKSLTTAERAWKRSKNPDFGVAQIPVAIMPRLKVPQEVKHWPEIYNWAHTLVIGKKTESVQKEIRRNAKIIIHTRPFRSGNSEVTQ
jgi:hypothetical protein